MFLASTPATAAAINVVRVFETDCRCRCARRRCPPMANAFIGSSGAWILRLVRYSPSMNLGRLLHRGGGIAVLDEQEAFSPFLLQPRDSSMIDLSETLAYGPLSNRSSTRPQLFWRLHRSTPPRLPSRRSWRFYPPPRPL